MKGAVSLYSQCLTTLCASNFIALSVKCNDILDRKRLMLKLNPEKPELIF